MGHRYTYKFVLLDEAQLNGQPADTTDALLGQVFDFISDEIAPYDDLDECSIELEWIASERLDTSENLDAFSFYKAPRQGDDWEPAFVNVLSAITRLPETLIETYRKSGSKAEIRDWLQNNPKANADFYIGGDGVGVPGFSPHGYFYDGLDEDHCDARPEDFGDGQRVIAYMKVFKGL